ncbi:RrF2 family transcriptional regulator [Adlercreutzia agrestimuris]|uniref:RrF2 family transcriptional regulator n=1 Tax=Adlercreutzia agrestimuris TaxID=2941324 RepID=UPI00203ED860|nr:Rrf2 family transcriptional regulator [Adlercreutzia agrestimuris]
MDVTRRCDYAFRILRVACQCGKEYVSVSDISEREGIPYAFARSIQHDLVKGGLIKTVRGARGGLALNCDPAHVSVKDVLEVIQGPVSVSTCVHNSTYCENCDSCVYNSLWRGADQLLNAYFASISLKDIIEMGGQNPVVQQALSVRSSESAKDADANTITFEQACAGFLSEKPSFERETECA